MTNPQKFLAVETRGDVTVGRNEYGIYVARSEQYGLLPGVYLRRESCDESIVIGAAFAAADDVIQNGVAVQVRKEDGYEGTPRYVTLRLHVDRSVTWESWL